jgi:hypothetical protein
MQQAQIVAPSIFCIQDLSMQLASRSYRGKDKGSCDWHWVFLRGANVAADGCKANFRLPGFSGGIRCAHVELLKLKRGPNGVFIRPRGVVGYCRLLVELNLLLFPAAVNGTACT